MTHTLLGTLRDLKVIELEKLRFKRKSGEDTEQSPQTEIWVLVMHLDV